MRDEYDFSGAEPKFPEFVSENFARMDGGAGHVLIQLLISDNLQFLHSPAHQRLTAMQNRYAIVR